MRPNLTRGGGANVADRAPPRATDIWRLVTRPACPPAGLDAGALRSQAAEFATLASPVLAEYLLRPAAKRLGIPLIPPDDVEKSRVGNRFNLVQQLKWPVLFRFQRTAKMLGYLLKSKPVMPLK